MNIYIIDDNSNNSYKPIIDEYKNKLSIMYHKIKENSGPGVARQIGINISKNPYIVFLDSDDCFYNDESLSHLYDSIII